MTFSQPILNPDSLCICFTAYLRFHLACRRILDPSFLSFYIAPFAYLISTNLSRLFYTKSFYWFTKTIAHSSEPQSPPYIANTIPHKPKQNNVNIQTYFPKFVIKCKDRFDRPIKIRLQPILLSSFRYYSLHKKT